MRFWVGNFDFEHQLAAGLAYQRTKKLERINAELIAHLIPLAQVQDAIVLSVPLPDSFLNELCNAGFPRIQRVTAKDVSQPSQLSPWGWSRSVLRDHGRSLDSRDIPDLEAVCRVNSRAFSFEFEARHAPVELAREIHSLDDLRDATNSIAIGENSQRGTVHVSKAESSSATKTRWVVKANFGMSGRERVCGDSSEFDEPTKRWIERRLQDGQRLFFEPWLDRIDEVSTHWDIASGADSEPRFVGITKLMCDASVRFQGNRVLSPDRLPAYCTDAIQQTRTLAEHIQAAGYLGPVGIDCMLHQTSNGPQLRIAQDINARWSMGRVALRAAELVGASEATLIHYPTTWFERLDVGESIDVTTALAKHWPTQISRAIRTTPRQIDGQATSHTSVLVVE